MVTHTQVHVNGHSMLNVDSEGCNSLMGFIPFDGSTIHSLVLGDAANSPVRAHSC